MRSYKKIKLYHEAINYEILEDFKAAFDLYLASARQGYPKAQLVVAKFYLGDGIYKGIIKQDKRKAMEFLHQAADGGNAEAKYRLALMMLKESDGKDVALAIDLLEDASERQFALATLELANCYFYGIGVKQNYVKTLSLLEKIVYGPCSIEQIKYYDTVRNILYEFKTLYLEHKETLGISEEYLCAFKDMCSDLDIGNWD